MYFPSCHKDTLELQRLYSEHSGSCTQALSQSCSRKRMSDFLLWFVILKNKKLTKKLSVAARLGDDFEMGQSFNESLYRFREEQASWKVTIAKWNRAAQTSSFLQKYRSRRIFLNTVLFICGLGARHIGFTHQDTFCFKIKQIITIQYFSPITKRSPLKRVGLCLALEGLVKGKC